MKKQYLTYLFIGIFFFGFTACDLFTDGDSISLTELEQEYIITRGACGHLIKQERLGASFSSALSELEERIAEWLPEYDFRLEPSRIEVENESGLKPVVRFRSIRVLNRENDILIYAVSDVLTSNGYYYKINWCPEAPPVTPG